VNKLINSNLTFIISTIFGCGLLYGKIQDITTQLAKIDANEALMQNSINQLTDNQNVLQNSLNEFKENHAIKYT
jgi:hypothetical protein